jgi:hypothetical protein
MMSLKLNRATTVVILMTSILFSAGSYAKSLLNISTLPTGLRMRAGETVNYKYTVTNPAANGITVLPTSTTISSSATLKTTVPQVQTSITANTCLTPLAPGANCQVSVTATAPATPGNYQLTLRINAAGGAGGANGRDNPFTLTEPATSGCTGPGGGCKIFATETNFTGDLAPQAGSQFQAAILSECGTKNEDGESLSYANCICGVEGRNISTGVWRALLSISTIDASKNVAYTNTAAVVRQDGLEVIERLGGLFMYLHTRGVTQDARRCVRTGTNGLTGAGESGCNNYTTTAEVRGGPLGYADSITSEWLSDNGVECNGFCPNADLGLYCMERPG